MHLDQGTPGTKVGSPVLIQPSLPGCLSLILLALARTAGLRETRLTRCREGKGSPPCSKAGIYMGCEFQGLFQDSELEVSPSAQRHDCPSLSDGTLGDKDLPLAS